MNLYKMLSLAHLIQLLRLDIPENMIHARRGYVCQKLQKHQF